MDTIFIIMLELTKKYKSGSALEIMQEAILFGDIPAGTSITQNELAESLGVSRMPVREALIALEYQGLVVRHSNQHAEVISLTDSDIRATFEDLAVLDGNAIHMSPFRRKMLATLKGVYLAFVLNNSDYDGKVDDYAALAEKLIEIRKERQENAQRQAG